MQLYALSWGAFKNGIARKTNILAVRFSEIKLRGKDKGKPLTFGKKKWLHIASEACPCVMDMRGETWMDNSCR